MLPRREQDPDRRWRWLALVAPLIAVIGAAILIYFLRVARPLWVDEEMLGLNVRDRSFTGLMGPLWMGQAAPLGWLVLERAFMLTAGVSERAVRALPVLWGLLTLATAVWAGRRWLGPVGAAVLALLCSFGTHVWSFALELKQYSADTFGGLLLPSLAAWAVQPSAGESPRKADAWWIIAGVMQWFSYGALFVAPGCGMMIAALTWQRSGRRAALRSAAFSLFWLTCAGLHYYVSIRHASGSAYLREYWASAFPPAAGSAADTLKWFAGRFDALARIPGGTQHSASFWIIAAAGLALGVREGSPLALLALMLATSAPSAFLLAACRLVPLSGRLSLWMLPSLYVGIAIAADSAARALRRSAAQRQWPALAGVLLCSFFVARLCDDIYRAGQYEMRIRPRSAHDLDDRGAIRSLMSQRRPGDAMLVSHLGLPAVWWYGGVNPSDPGMGASLPDGGPIFEVWHAWPGGDCGPDDLRTALSGVTGATMYLGFELENHLEDLVLDRLAELGAVTTYRRFAESGHAAVIDLRQAPTGRILRPGGGTVDPRSRPEGCVTIQRAQRW